MSATTTNVSAPVRTATAAEEERALAVLALAFATDPVARWSWPDPHTYLTSFNAFARAYGGRAFEEGTAQVVGDFTGVALWLPPNVTPDEEAMGALILQTAPEGMHDELFAVVEQMGAYHPPEPHWYLPMLGIDPALQGQGYGSTLLADAAARFDRDGVVAYLESSNPKNVPLYERYGFTVLGEIQAGTSPTIYPMLRTPR